MRFARGVTILAAALCPALSDAASSTPPEIRENAQPRMRYEVVATIKDAPGPFDSISGIADYRVVNELCVTPSRLSGVRVVPEKRADIVFKRESPGVYRAVIYLDLIQDEDYFGKGLCHWALAGTAILLKHNSVTFSPALFHDDVMSGKRVSRYFAESVYATAGAMRIDTGVSDRTQFHGNGKLFTVTMKAEGNTP